MTIAALLTELRRRDVRLRADGDLLRFDAPPGAMTPELREHVLAHKPALLASLRAIHEPTEDRITPVRRDQPLPVSFAQRRMWLLQQLTPDSPMYNLAGAIRLRGSLDTAALAASLAAIQQRHEILRTTFTLVADEPVQIVHDGAAAALAITDLGALDAAAQHAALRTMAEAWARAPFDLAAGPLFRVQLVRVAADEHVLLLAFHHIVFDGWSIGVFVRELTAFYRASTADGNAAVADLPVQYADFAAWQRTWLRGDRLAAGLGYWRQQLAGPLPVLELPADRPRPERQTFNGGLHEFGVGPEVAGRIESLALAAGATPFMALLAAFNVLLYRYTSQRDLIVGSPIANRNRPELEPLLGCFVNTLALRTRVAPELTFVEVLGRVRDTCLDAYEHQDIPVETLVEELRLDRDTAHSALYQVMFALQTASAPPLELPALTVAPMALDAVTAKFDLTLSMRQSAGGFAGVLEFNTDLFDRSTIEGFGRSFCTLLASIASHPDTRIDALAVMAEAAGRAVRAGGTGAAGPDPGGPSLGARVLAVAAATPDAVAVADGTTRVTYGALAATARQVAGTLRAHGVGPNVPVGVWQARDAALIETLVGITVAGGAYVPLEIGQPAARAVAVLTAVGARVVVTTAARAAEVPAGPWQVVVREAVAAAAAAGTGAPAVTAAAGTADDLAYVLFTSGSTGTPKGVAVPQRAVVRLVVGTDYVALGPAAVIGQAATVAFDAATFEIWGALLHGARLVVIPAAVVLAPTALGAYVRRTGVTTLFLTTAVVHQIGQHAAGALAGLETLLFGGEAVEPRWVAAIQAAGGPRRMLHVYGPTETTTFATWAQLETVAPDARTLPIGGPIAQMQAVVVDGGGAVAPVGVAGELLLGGEGLAWGYLGAARATAARFVPDGVTGAVGGRLYRTGDVVRWTAPGVLTFVGRRDGQVKLRGHRIELGEVEQALTQVAGVGGAVVVVRGDGETRQLVGYVAPAAGATLTVLAVRTALQARLPGYMVPGALVVLDALPLTANGKVDRRALPAPAAASAPGAGLVLGGVAGTIAAVWRTVLDVPAVDATTSFFDLGGHSLLLVRVQAGLEAALGRAVPLLTLFQYPTIATLAAHLDGTSPDAGAAASTTTLAANDAIAIVGLAGRFAGAQDLDEFWRLLRDGSEAITRFSDEQLAAAGIPAAVRQDPRFVPARGVLADAEAFDAALFGLSARDADLLDPQHRVLLECAWTALEHAGYAPTGSGRLRIGVYAGASASTYLFGADPAALAGVSPLQALLASDRDFLSTRVSYLLDLRGPAVSVQSACSTSLVAVHSACQALLAGECDLALAGGVSVGPAVGGYLYHPDGITSPDGHCRAFDVAAAGTLPGQGVGLVVLKRLSAARADGDTIHAVIRGTAINNDGAGKVGFTAPSVTGQAAVIAAAQAAAGVTPQEISYVEAHGTGTALGDPIEVAALRQVWDAAGATAPCVLGAVKTNLGHLDAAAGVAGLIKTVLALTHAAIPPTLHFTAPNPALPLGPFAVAPALTPWPAGAQPRRAGVSSFGMGGTNAHVIVEEAPARSESDPGRPWVILPVAGATDAAAAAAAGQLATTLETQPDLPLADVAYTLQVGRAALRARRVVVGQEAAALAAALRTAPTTTVTSAPPVIWVFPGQGSQTPGMGQALDAQEPAYRAELDACAAVVAALGLGDLRAALAGTTPEGTTWLAGTQGTQVALVAVELALAALWRAWGLTPTAVIGHSVGELAAAVVAGVLTRDSALTLAATRGALMAGAPPGGMLAVAADVDTVTRYLGPDLWLAAINGPRQCVIAGAVPSLDLVESRLEAAGISSHLLPAPGAFHSGLMSAVAAPLTGLARALPHDAPSMTWISTVTGAAVAERPFDADYWGAQVTAPVLWARAVETVRRAASAPPVWLEVGPGHTLTNLIRSGAPSGERMVAPLAGDDAARGVATALGQLWAAGLTPDWRAYHAWARRRRVALPGYPFERTRHLLPRATAESQLARQQTAAIARRDDSDSWFYRPLWKQAQGLRVPTAPTRRRSWLLLGDDNALRQRLADRLIAHGDGVVTAMPGVRFVPDEGLGYELRSQAADDYRRLFTALDGDGRYPTDIVHLLAATPAGDSVRVEEDVAAAEERSFYSLLALGHALANRQADQPVTLHVVTSDALAVTGDEPASPLKALAIGPVRVIPAEVHGARSALIDLQSHVVADPPPGVIERLVAELIGDAGVPLVAHRGAHRWVQAFERLHAPADGVAPARLRPGGVCLITGGLGAIGLTLAELLFETVGARLVLVSRRALPAPDEWHDHIARGGPLAGVLTRLRELERAGAEVLVVPADVTSGADMERVLAQTHRRFGAVHGAIHAAGVAGGGVVALKDAAAAAAVLAPKVRGTLVLERVLAAEPLEFVVLCSSLSAIIGGAGQVDYVAANAFLDAVAQARSTAGRSPVIGINWDTWAQAGMAVDAALPAGLERRRAQVLEAGLTQQEGRLVFSRALQADVPQAIVSTKNLEALIAVMGAAALSPPGQTARPSRHPRPPLTTGYVAPTRDSERRVCAAFAQALGVAEVGIHDNFFELGGHSLLAVELMFQLNHEFKTSVPVAALYDRLTPGLVAVPFEPSAAGRDTVVAAAPARRRPARRPAAARRRESISDRRSES